MKSSFVVAIVAASPIAASAGSYDTYSPANCYGGHGGTEIDIGGGVGGMTSQACQERCDADDACDCVTFADAGTCWKRASCNPSEFAGDYGYTVYVKKAGPQPSPVPPPTPAPTPVPTPVPTPTPGPPAGSYDHYANSNCYAGHGGVEIDAGGVGGKTVQTCQERCDEDDACDCVTFGGGTCWKRASCNPSEFTSDSNFDVYVKKGGPQPSPVPSPTPTPTPVPTPVPTPTPPGPSGPLGKDSWHMCPSPGQCGSQDMRSWNRSPASLVGSVGDFSSVPGISHASYSDVAAKWKSSPPSFNGRAVSLSDIADFARELLSSDPFGTGDQVPWVDFWNGEKVAAITQRHLAFLVVNAMMGNDISGGNGLSTAMSRCSQTDPVHGRPNVGTAFVWSSLSLLGVLSQELAGGSFGTMLVGATPGYNADGWKERLGSTTMERPGQVCKLMEGQMSSCAPSDFMSGGTQFQALTDIAGGSVGGGAQLCDTANSQDESLVQFYAEVFAFAFFVGPNEGGGMLPVPFTLLGTRRYVNFLTGESSRDSPYYSRCGLINDDNWLNEDLGTVSVVTTVGGKRVPVMASSFVAVASMGEGGSCSLEDMMNNNCDHQRRHLDEDIKLWYRAFESTMYDDSIQDAFRDVVKSVGTGPWGSGVWWGDSQMYFLTMWLATSLLRGPKLDYYIYDHFCENPGNQCFVLGGDECSACVTKGGGDYRIKANRCGAHDVEDIQSRWTGQSVQNVYDALTNVGGPPTQVFDMMAVEGVFSV